MKDFKVELSLDGSSWTEVVDATLSDQRNIGPEAASIQKFAIQRCSVYLRLVQKTYYGSGGGVASFKLLGEPNPKDKCKGAFQLKLDICRGHIEAGLQSLCYTALH